MCDVCAVFGIGDHWTDGAKLARGLFPARDIQRHRRLRRRRIALLDTLLAPLGLSCEDWDGDGFVLTDLAGRMRVAGSLPELWRVAEEMSGRTIDPLAADFAPNGAVSW